MQTTRNTASVKSTDIYHNSVGATPPVITRRKILLVKTSLVRRPAEPVPPVGPSCLYAVYVLGVAEVVSLIGICRSGDMHSEEEDGLLEHTRPPRC